MKQFLKDFIHRPHHVAIVSTIVAIAIGGYGYFVFNEEGANAVPAPAEKSTGPAAPRLTLGFLAGGRIKAVNVKPGDAATKGEILAELDSGSALGGLTQAKAGYAAAKAALEKLMNSGSSPAVNVAKAAVNAAKSNFDAGEKAQNVLVDNAYRNLLNSTAAAFPIGEAIDSSSPTVSGAYTLGKEGTIRITVYGTNAGARYSASGLVDSDGWVSATTPEPIGASGLYIQFPSSGNSVADWVINIPNTRAANYLANYNAYHSALETRSQTIVLLQASLDSANASLESVAAARPEDIAAAKAQIDAALGAVQTAQAAYDATIIRAPSDGKVGAISIQVGQIAAANAPAIEFEPASGQ